MRKTARTLLATAAAIFGAVLSFQATTSGTVWKASREDLLRYPSLCTLELPSGQASASASFTTSRTVERFCVSVRPEARRESLLVEISGRQGILARVSAVQSIGFQCGSQIPPGNYTATLSQEAGTHGGLVVIAETEPPTGITAWQIWSWALLGALLLSGVWALLARKSADTRQCAMSAYTFQMLLLCFLMIFLYLFLHEGGHALGEIAFGRHDFARSDFWGIHGSPHSAGKGGLALTPWKQAVISGGGPLTPVLTGWILFLFWRSRAVRSWFQTRPLLDLYFSALIVLTSFSCIVFPGYLLGITSDGDWRGFIGHVPGPLWFVKTLLWCVVAGSAFVLWRVLPVLWRVWRTKSAQVRETLAEHPRPL
jgi:hypothetical protein